MRLNASLLPVLVRNIKAPEGDGNPIEFGRNDYEERSVRNIKAPEGDGNLL